MSTNETRIVKIIAARRKPLPPATSPFDNDPDAQKLLEIFAGPGAVERLLARRDALKWIGLTRPALALPDGLHPARFDWSPAGGHFIWCIGTPERETAVALIDALMEAGAEGVCILDDGGALHLTEPDHGRNGR